MEVYLHITNLVNGQVCLNGDFQSKYWHLEIFSGHGVHYGSANWTWLPLIRSVHGMALFRILREIYIVPLFSPRKNRLFGVSVRAPSVLTDILSANNKDWSELAWWDGEIWHRNSDNASGSKVKNFAGYVYRYLIILKLRISKISKFNIH